ncbi:hypothetical protein, partial [Corynebacterium macginleyi]|uniref:hypothetical protein n=1 Tax=Corynebacterium macginleyi TaxID=38290 RepID=UPI001F378CAB
PGSNSPQKNFRTTTSQNQGREKPKPNKKQTTTNHTKSRLMLAIKKLLQRKNHCLPHTRRGKNKKETKVEHNHMPTNPTMQPKH